MNKICNLPYESEFGGNVIFGDEIPESCLRCIGRVAAAGTDIAYTEAMLVEDHELQASVAVMEDHKPAYYYQVKREYKGRRMLEQFVGVDPSGNTADYPLQKIVSHFYCSNDQDL